jgi:hypothetical protein
MGMSYRRAWVLVDELNGSLASAAVESAIGGEHGGGSTLTALGPKLSTSTGAIEIDRGAGRAEGHRPPARARDTPSRARRSAATPTITLDALKTASARHARREAERARARLRDDGHDPKAAGVDLDLGVDGARLDADHRSPRADCAPTTSSLRRRRRRPPMRP